MLDKDCGLFNLYSPQFLHFFQQNLGLRTAQPVIIVFDCENWRWFFDYLQFEFLFSFFIVFSIIVVELCDLVNPCPLPLFVESYER